MVSHESNSMTHIFLITDGAVENERDICNVVQEACTAEASSPYLRISTLGIGKHLFLYSVGFFLLFSRGEGERMVLRIIAIEDLYLFLLLSIIYG